jgi:hypothetical protein
VKRSLSLALALSLASSLGIASDVQVREPVQVTDFYEKRNALINDLLKENRTLEDVLLDLQRFREQLEEERQKKKYARAGEATLVVTGVAGVLLGSYLKRFGPTEIFNIGLGGKWMTRISGFVTLAGIAGGETYIRVKNENMKDLSLRIEAEIEILKNEFGQNAAVIEALRNN